MDQVVSATSDMLSEIESLNNVSMENQMQAIEEMQNAALIANDKELQAKLQAAGVADKTAIESAQIKLDEATKTGDAILIKEATDALTKEKILAEFQAKEDAINKKAAMDKYAIELAQFNTNKVFSLAQIAIDTAVNIIKQFPNPWGMGAAATLGILQAIAVNSQMPPSPPALADGGIVMPRLGGTLANIAEAGQPEIVFPLDKLNQFIGNGNTATGNNGGDNIHLVVNLDSKPFLDKIFTATKNRTVLISGGAVV